MEKDDGERNRSSLWQTPVIPIVQSQIFVLLLLRLKSTTVCGRTINTRRTYNYIVMQNITIYSAHMASYSMTFNTKCSAGRDQIMK